MNQDFMTPQACAARLRALAEQVDRLPPQALVNSVWVCSSRTDLPVDIFLHTGLPETAAALGLETRPDGIFLETVSRQGLPRFYQLREQEETA